MDINNGDLSFWGLLAHVFSAPALVWLVGLAVVFLIGFLIVCIVRAWSGSPASFFGISVGERPKGNKKLEEKYNALRQDFQTLDAMSEQTNVVMQLLTYLIADLQMTLWDRQCNSASSENAYHKAQRLYELVFEAINTSLSTGKDQYHRFGIFTPCSEGHILTLHKYRGFGTNAANDLKLQIGTSRDPKSVAGRSYLYRRQVYVHDIKQEPSYTPNPKSTTEYNSLACTPIFSGSECIGVLSVDAKKGNAFCEQDLKFMEVFAGMISLVMYWEHIAYDSNADREAIS